MLSQATPENEKYWLSKALRHPTRVLERLLRQEAYGSRGLAPGGEAERVHLHSQLTVQEMAWFQQYICLNAELLAGAAFPNEKSWKKVRDQVDKELEARRQQDQWPAPPSDRETDMELDPEELAEAPWEALAAVAIGCPEGVLAFLFCVKRKLSIQGFIRGCPRRLLVWPGQRAVIARLASG